MQYETRRRRELSINHLEEVGKIERYINTSYDGQVTTNIVVTCPSVY